ncbi:MAG: Nif3-like dinuclear metal center hexameric protein [Peptococcaceae bacterium]|jgi:dinuclear metal center YbgI/SA1388 family protein|nr:Nif3-like dinuclear metal center hexameric protein [Peptococcaceae bacterium]
MSYTCRDVCNQIDAFAPPRCALEGDPIGLQLGSYDQKADRLFMALELTSGALEEALDFRPDIVFVHHTPFFVSLKQLIEDERHDQAVLELIRNHIALYTAHTNLDCVKGGVNDVLADRLGIVDTEILKPLNLHITEAGLGRIGTLRDAVTLGEFARFVDRELDAGGIRYAGEESQIVHKVAVCGGAGAFLIAEAKARGANTYISADIKHHEGVQAIEVGLGLIDAGHFASEAPIIPVLADYLREKMPELTIGVSEADCNPFSVTIR